jgi:hypothetical protein
MGSKRERRIKMTKEYRVNDSDDEKGLIPLSVRMLPDHRSILNERLPPDKIIVRCLLARQAPTREVPEPEIYLESTLAVGGDSNLHYRALLQHIPSIVQTLPTDKFTRRPSNYRIWLVPKGELSATVRAAAKVHRLLSELEGNSQLGRVLAEADEARINANLAWTGLTTRRIRFREAREKADEAKQTLWNLPQVQGLLKLVAEKQVIQTNGSAI